MIAYTCSFIISAGFISSERLSTFKLRHEAFKASLALRLVLSPARSPTVTLQLAARLYVLQVFYIARPPSKIYDLVVQPEDAKDTENSHFMGNYGVLSVPSVVKTFY